METTELFYPEIKAFTGGYCFDKAVEIEIYSDQETYFDWAKIRFTPEFQPVISLEKKEKGIILLGYNGALQQAFEGYVAHPYNSGGYLNEITLKDEMLLLEETDITNTFLDVTPQEILTYCLAKAGVSDYKLSPQGYPTKKVVPIFQKNIIAVIKEVHAIWKLDHKFFFSDGTFYWGELPEQELVYHFEYGVNIISLERPLRMWELETVSMPFVKHSHKIRVTHPKISGEFEVKKMVFSTNETGFIRTRIYF